MSKIMHCGLYARCKVYRILSSIAAYRYQLVYKGSRCRRCSKTPMMWSGEYPDGTITDRYEIDSVDQKKWEQRIKRDKPRPKIQMTGEYTLKVSGPIETQIEYQEKLRRAYQVPLHD